MSAVAADRGLDDRRARSAHGPRRRFRLAFWSEQAEHHGPRLQRALDALPAVLRRAPAGVAGEPRRGARTVPVRARAPPGRPRARDGLDIARFNELTKQMSAYAHYQRGQEHLELTAKRAARRAPGTRARRATQPAAALPPRRARARSAAADRTAAAGLRAPGTPGRRAHAVRQCRNEQLRLEQRDERLLAGRPPATRTAATGPPTATHSNGGCRCPPGGGRRRRRRHPQRCSDNVFGRSTRRDPMHARRLTASRQPRPFRYAAQLADAPTHAEAGAHRRADRPAARARSSSTPAPSRSCTASAASAGDSAR